MKNLGKMNFTIHRGVCVVALAALLFALCVPEAYGSSKKQEDIYDLTLDENLGTPEINNDKRAKKIEKYQYDVAVELKRQNLDVEMMRDDEVIIVSFPASQLFLPNDTVLTDLGKASLKPMLKFLKNPGFYKMLLVMHSDNTGSDKYTLALSRSRVNSVYDWFDANGSVDFVVPYALGSTDPLVPNNSVENRKMNRRLEIYLVPGDVMIDQSKKDKININYISK